MSVQIMLRGDGTGHGHVADADCGSLGCRPLVVIDPEDREQVERLARVRHIALTGDVPAWSTLSGKSQASRMDALAIALDAEIASPKPEEPTGLGAVVEDDGREWIHFGNGCWIKSVPNANLETRSWWEFSDAVREVTP